MALINGNDAVSAHFRAELWGTTDDSKVLTSASEVLDGDTVKVQFPDGRTESVRILGADTPEKRANRHAERLQEWEGIESHPYLESHADDATAFAETKLSGATVELVFDDDEPVRDGYDRVLGYLYYDDTGDGSRDSLYNYQLVEGGYARVYGSGLTEHDRFWHAEHAAREQGRRVWTDSDPNRSPEVRDDPVEALFFPETASVRTSVGGLPAGRAPVYAAASAAQDLDGGHAYSGDVPLVGVDETARVAVVGGPFIDEAYEAAEGYDVDTSGYGNFPFLTNLVSYLADRTGDVVIDGGHGQFAANYALSNEDAAYYQRYLEGQDVQFDQFNDLVDADLAGTRAVFVCTPTDPFTTAEMRALDTFAASGGAVVLFGSGRTTAAARSNLNDLARGLGTDLRVNEDQVYDESNNVGTTADVPTTTNFDDSFPLFAAYTP